jgi:hypothetical protein
MPKCDHLTDKGSCRVATDLLIEYNVRDVPVTNGACDSCMGCDQPKQVNQVTTSLALYSIRTRTGTVPKQLLADLKPYLCRERVAPSNGPGTQLKKILSWFASSDGCRCESHATQMNLWGPDRCEKNIEIIVDWLIESAELKRLNCAEFITRHLARLAVKRSIAIARRYG